MTTRHLPRLAPRTRGLLLMSAAAALTLSGCGLKSPQQTDYPYQPADGVETNLSTTLMGRDVLIIADQKDGPGRVVGQLINTGADPVDLTFKVADGAQAALTIPAHSSTDLANATDGVTLAKVPSAPGGMTPLIISSATTGEDLLNVPVLPTQGYYASLTPAPTASASASPQASSSAAATPSGTASASPSASATP